MWSDSFHITLPKELKESFGGCEVYKHFTPHGVKRWPSPSLKLSRASSLRRLFDQFVETLLLSFLPINEVFLAFFNQALSLIENLLLPIVNRQSLFMLAEIVP